MMSDEMIERVAEALATASGANWNAQNFNETLGGETPQELRAGFRDLARAAIEATTVKGDGLVERLLNDEVKQGPEADPLCQEAADTITTLKGEIERLDRALDDAVATIAAVRATTTVPEEWAASAKHFHDVCGDTLVRIRQALGSTDNVG